MQSSGVFHAAAFFCAYVVGNRVYGLWFMVYGLWFMVYGLWFMVQSQKLIANRQQQKSGSLPSRP